MIIELLSIELLISMVIIFYFTVKHKFKEYVIFYGIRSANEATYAFAGDIE